MATEIQIEKPRVRLSDLVRLPEFQTLSEKQQIFCAVYCASGFLTGHYSAVEAAAMAYSAKKNAAVLGAELLGQSKIRRVLDIHFGRNALDSILSDLQKAVKRGLRRNNRSRPVTVTPEVERALLIFERYITAKGNAIE